MRRSQSNNSSFQSQFSKASTISTASISIPSFHKYNTDYIRSSHCLEELIEMEGVLANRAEKQQYPTLIAMIQTRIQDLSKSSSTVSNNKNNSVPKVVGTTSPPRRSMDLLLSVEESPVLVTDCSSEYYTVIEPMSPFDLDDEESTSNNINNIIIVDEDENDETSTTCRNISSLTSSNNNNNNNNNISTMSSSISSPHRKQIKTLKLKLQSQERRHYEILSLAEEEMARLRKSSQRLHESSKLLSYCSLKTLHTTTTTDGDAAVDINIVENMSSQLQTKNEQIQELMLQNDELTYLVKLLENDRALILQRVAGSDKEKEVIKRQVELVEDKANALSKALELSEEKLKTSISTNESTVEDLKKLKENLNASELTIKVLKMKLFDSTRNNLLSKAALMEARTQHKKETKDVSIQASRSSYGCCNSFDCCQQSNSSSQKICQLSPAAMAVDEDEGKREEEKNTSFSNLIYTRKKMKCSLRSVGGRSGLQELVRLRKNQSKNRKPLQQLKAVDCNNSSNTMSSNEFSGKGKKKDGGISPNVRRKIAEDDATNPLRSKKMERLIAYRKVNYNRVI